jgi:phosphoserine aminotransferase
VFSIYVTLLVTRWLLHHIGGLARMNAINMQKAGKMYDFLDNSDGFFKARAAHGDRSLMNAVFTLPTTELEARFLAESSEAGFSGLGGHRAIGGIRASMYNALSLSAVEQLLEFMGDFQQKNRH